MLEWIYYVRPVHLLPNYLHGAHRLKVRPFTQGFEKYIYANVSASLKNSVMAILHRPGMTVGMVAIKWGYLNPMGMKGPQGCRGQVVTLNCQRQLKQKSE